MKAELIMAFKHLSHLNRPVPGKQHKEKTVQIKSTTLFINTICVLSSTHSAINVGVTSDESTRYLTILIKNDIDDADPSYKYAFWDDDDRDASGFLMNSWKVIYALLMQAINTHCAHKENEALPTLSHAVDSNARKCQNPLSGFNYNT